MISLVPWRPFVEIFFQSCVTCLICSAQGRHDGCCKEGWTERGTKTLVVICAKPNLWSCNTHQTPTRKHLWRKSPMLHRVLASLFCSSWCYAGLLIPCIIPHNWTTNLNPSQVITCTGWYTWWSLHCLICPTSPDTYHPSQLKHLATSTNLKSSHVTLGNGKTYIVWATILHHGGLFIPSAVQYRWSIDLILSLGFRVVGNKVLLGS